MTFANEVDDDDDDDTQVGFHRGKRRSQSDAYTTNSNRAWQHGGHGYYVPDRDSSGENKLPLTRTIPLHRNALSVKATVKTRKSIRTQSHLLILSRLNSPRDTIPLA